MQKSWATSGGGEWAALHRSLQEGGAMTCIRVSAVAVAGVLLTILSPRARAAEGWPAKPVRVIVPFAPGGSNDIIGRMVAQQLGDRLGRQVIVDNRAGAGGTIGTEVAAKSPPDGYTLLVVSLPYAYNPFMYKLTYDQEKLLAPIAMIGTGPSGLAVNPSLPAKSAKDLIALAKAKPGHLNYASAGSGSFQHLSTELFKQLAGIKVEHIPFKGGGPAMIDVIAGNTQFCMGSLLQMLPHMNSKRLRVIGTGGAKRSPTVPDVPTIAESGLPGYEANNWWGVVAPAGLSADIVARLEKELAAVAASPDTKKRLEAEGAEPSYKGPAEFAKFIKTEMNKWGKVVKESGIKGDV
jgi:tripartite-type tricarboxylate transporter receptor subunit TctC